MLFFQIVHRVWGSDLAWNRAVLAAAWTVVTLAISALSWHLFETPINGLKRYVPYVVAPADHFLVNCAKPTVLPPGSRT